MSKRKRKRKSDVVVKLPNGHKIKCYPIVFLMDAIKTQFTERLDALVIPTYELAGVGDSSITKTYNDKTILGKDVPEEDQIAYTEYKVAANRINSEASMAQLKAIAVKGSRVLTRKPEEEWIANLEFLGIEVPESENERLWLYFKTEVLSSIQDGIQIILGVTRASGVSEEVIAKRLASFQNKMGGGEGTDAAEDREDSEREGQAEAEAGLDSEHDVQSGEHST